MCPGLIIEDRMKRVICLLTLVMLVSGCATVKINYGSLTNDSFPSKDENAEILLTTKDIDRPYEEVGIISASVTGEGITFEEMNQRMKEKAREIGADAIIKIEYGTTNGGIMIPSSAGYGSFGALLSLPYSKGLAIKYIN